MSTHAYYKDRLGFDPDEVNGDNGYDKSQQGYEENLSKFKGNVLLVFFFCFLSILDLRNTLRWSKMIFF